MKKWRRPIIYALCMAFIIFVASFSFNWSQSQIVSKSDFSLQDVVDSEITNVNKHSYRQKIFVKENNFAGIRIYEDIIGNIYNTYGWVEVYFKVSLFDGEKLIDEFKFEKLFPGTDNGSFDVDIEPIADSAGKTYDLVIEPYREFDQVVNFSLIKEEDDAEPTLDIDGAESEFKFAYLVLYRNNAATGFFITFTAIAVFLQAVGFVLLRKTRSTEGKYAVLALMVGLSCALILPNYAGHDEVFHFGRVYDILEGHLMPEVSERKWPEIKIDREQYPFVNDIYDNIVEARDDMQITNNYQYVDLEFSGVYPPIAYIPSILSLSFARLILPNSPLYWMYIMRLFQLFVCVIIMYFAIKITPVYKRSFAIIAMIPSCMTAINFVSADSLLFCMLMLQIAQVLQIIKTKKPITKMQYAVLLVSSIFISLTKLVYLPMIFIMIAILLSRKVRGDKSRIFSIIGISCFSVLVWNIFAMRVLTQGQGVNTWYIVGYYLRRPIELIQIILHTQYVYGWNHFTDLFMRTPGAFMSDIYGSTMAVFLFAVVASLAFFNEKEFLNKKSKILVILILIATFILISLSLLVACTPVRYEEIMGIQGRYFWPFIPLLLLVAANKKLKVPEKLYEYLPEVIMLLYFMLDMSAIVGRF